MWSFEPDCVMDLFTFKRFSGWSITNILIVYRPTAKSNPTTTQPIVYINDFQNRCANTPLALALAPVVVIVQNQYLECDDTIKKTDGGSEMFPARMGSEVCGGGRLYSRDVEPAKWRRFAYIHWKAKRETALSRILIDFLMPPLIIIICRPRARFFRKHVLGRMWVRAAWECTYIRTRN